MVFRVFIFYFFCLEAMVKKNTSMRTISITVMMIFQKCWSESYLISAMFKVLPQQLRGTLTTAFERYFTVEDLRTWINIHTNSFLNKYHEMKMGEGAVEIISCTNIRACSLKNIASGHFTSYCILLCLSNKPSF